MANEKRLIDATEARKHSTHDIITHFLDRCPTVDALEVVRCKDCKHWEKSWIEGVSRGRCVGGIPRKSLPDDFCSYGERREGE